MTTTLAQDISLPILTDEQLAAISTSTISISSTGSNYYSVGYVPTPSVTFTSGTTGSTFCIPPLSASSISVWGHTEWVDSFPSWARVEKMCDEYPGLKLAFEKFKNTYNLVKDDYDTPPERRFKP